MLPENSIEEIETEDISYKAYALDFENKTVGGIIDGKEALVQAVRMALITQRYKYPVFSHSYGTDYTEVFSEGYAKAMARLKNAIYDSLIYDERIKAVDNFVFDKKGNKMLVSFRIVSVYGPMGHEIEVDAW